MYIRQIFVIQKSTVCKACIINNHMVGLAGSVVSPFYSILLDLTWTQWTKTFPPEPTIFWTKIFFFHFSDLFFAFFSALSSTQTIKVIGLIFFSMSWHWQIGLCTCISTHTYSLRPFSRGGTNLPRLYIDSDPPAFIGLTRNLFI